MIPYTPCDTSRCFFETYPQIFELINQIYKKNFKKETLTIFLNLEFSVISLVKEYIYWNDKCAKFIQTYKTNKKMYVYYIAQSVIKMLENLKDDNEFDTYVTIGEENQEKVWRDVLTILLKTDLKNNKLLDSGQTLLYILDPDYNKYFTTCDFCDGNFNDLYKSFSFLCEEFPLHTCQMCLPDYRKLFEKIIKTHCRLDFFKTIQIVKINGKIKKFKDPFDLSQSLVRERIVKQDIKSFMNNMAQKEDSLKTLKTFPSSVIKILIGWTWDYGTLFDLKTRLHQELKV